MSRSSPAAARAVAVLNLVVQHPTRAFTLTDLVRSLQLSRATCHAVLVTLVEAGYLYRLANKSYVIGPALIAAGRIAREHFSPLELAREEMRGLSDKYRVMCSAFAVEGDEIELRDLVGGTSHMRWLTQVGHRSPLNSRWNGLIYAWDSDETIRRWFAMIDLDPASETGKQLFAKLLRARGDGYYFALQKEGWTVEKVGDLSFKDRQLYIDYLTSDLDDDNLYSVSFMMAPVRNEKGTTMVIGMSAPQRPLSGVQIREMGETLAAACGRVSSFLQQAA